MQHHDTGFCLLPSPSASSTLLSLHMSCLDIASGLKSVPAGDDQSCTLVTYDDPSFPVRSY